MNLIKWLSTPTNYSKQQLSTKQKKILDYLDTYLTEHSNTKLMSNALSLKILKIGIYSQHLTVTYLIEHFIKELRSMEYAYIPRSISLICDPQGTWCFYVGIRNSNVADETAIELFLDGLNRTNQARVE